MQLFSPSLSRSVFPFSFLLSHLVTRPLERSVEFPLSQSRGQSEPHKDPQWTPSALSSLPSVTAQLHTHTETLSTDLYKNTPIACYSLFAVYILTQFLLFLFSTPSSFLRLKPFCLTPALVLCLSKNFSVLTAVCHHFLFIIKSFRKPDFVC